MERNQKAAEDAARFAKAEAKAARLADNNNEGEEGLVPCELMLAPAINDSGANVVEAGENKVIPILIQMVTSKKTWQCGLNRM